MTTPTIRSKLVPFTDSCAELNIGRSKMFALINEGALRRVKLGRKTYIPRTDLDEFIDGLIAASGDEQTTTGGDAARTHRTTAPSRSLSPDAAASPRAGSRPPRRSPRSRAARSPATKTNSFSPASSPNSPPTKRNAATPRTSTEPGIPRSRSRNDEHFDLDGDENP